MSKHKFIVCNCKVKVGRINTYSPADPPPGSTSCLIFLGLPAFGLGGLPPDLGVFVMKWEKISVCFNRNSNLFERSVSILLSKSPSLPLEDVVSLEDPFCYKKKYFLAFVVTMNHETKCGLWHETYWIFSNICNVHRFFCLRHDDTK